MSKEKKPKFYKDRFLTAEKPENVYFTVALYFLVFFMSFILIFVSFVSMCAIEGGSMNDTLSDGGNVLLRKGNSGVERGSVVVFAVKYVGDDGKQHTKNLIKRVVAVGGDKVFFLRNDDSTVTLYRKNAGSSEFKLIDELSGDAGYKIKAPMQGNAEKMGILAQYVLGRSDDPEEKAYTVEDGFLLCLGDNRNNSTDSRDAKYGPIPTDAVEGVMFYALEKGSLLEKLLQLIYPERKQHGKVYY